MTTRHYRWSLTSLVLVAALAPLARGQEPAVVELPKNVRAVWDIDKAYRRTTSTRERICVNGLWRWQPARGAVENVPEGQWGFFKVPGCWPGITDYMQKDCQTVYSHPAWKNVNLAEVTTAWYQREVTIPATWADRRRTLRIDDLNSHATAWIDGKNVGELVFPGGELDLTEACRPGERHVLSLLVVALPLKGVMLSYTDSAAAREVKGAVARRGLCGDVFLESAPLGVQEVIRSRPRIEDVRLRPSIRRGELSVEVAVAGLVPNVRYRLRTEIKGADLVFDRDNVTTNSLENGRMRVTVPWKPAKLWDLHTPENKYDARVLLMASGDSDEVFDVTYFEPIGFREFWIDGRDFYLNGKRIFLSSVPLDNAQISAGLASYEGAKESLRRLKSFGINFVYTHNYGCEPGSHLAFEEILRAADDVGMLVSLSQPHFSHYSWQAADADQSNGYARHAEAYVRKAGNHPSVVCYSMSHNATGYAEDMNPDLIAGRTDPRDTWATNNARLALRAEAIVKRFDPDRIVYHHASGNLGSMHTSNFYPNFTPVQELSDWFEQWATSGTKPVFTCEYGAPFTWDWSMYRGWYKGERSFGSARVPWEFCFAEWNAQFLGDRAYRIGEPEKRNLRWEAQQFRADRLWHRWDYPFEIGSRAFDDRYEVLAQYLTDNWRAFRTWGMSANSPWEHGHYWKLRDGVDKRRKELATDWDRLQRPGFSPDFVEGRYERIDLAFEPDDWVPTAAAQALLRNNRPLLAYLAGHSAHFTSKDHQFQPGASIEKQIVVINNSRTDVKCLCGFSLDLPTPISGQHEVTLATGQQERIPLRLELPKDLAAGSYTLKLSAKFSTGETQADAFRLDVLPPTPPVVSSARIALMDPRGETGALLDRLGVAYRRVDADADVRDVDLLVLGKLALTVDGAGPDLSRVRDGLKVVVFEQSSEVLEQRLGFRVVEYGLRQVFPRIPDHPLIAGLSKEHWHDWCGAATIVPPRLKYEMRPRYGPTISWCGIPVTRAWRCGNFGNVASVLIEKPARGDFLPIVDGGFSLQYSPLMEYREGRGLIVFCQLDVTGRTDTDPAAQRVARNIIDYASGWKPTPRRAALYAGDAAGKRHWEKAGLEMGAYDGGALTADQVLVVGPGGGQTLAPHAEKVRAWLAAGGHFVGIGLDARDVQAVWPGAIKLAAGEHIATYFEAVGMASPFAGIGPADVHNRDPRSLPLVSDGARILGDGVLAADPRGNAALLQMPPWEFGDDPRYNRKRTYRRLSVTATRLLANMGVAGTTPLVARFHSGVDRAKPESRWLDGFYLDQPEEWDDPYRFFRW